MKNSKKEIDRLVNLFRMPKWLADKFRHGYLELEDIIHINVLIEQNNQQARGLDYYC